MGTLSGPFLVAAALLAAGGASKVVRPANTARALGEMGLPDSATLVRGGAALELAVAAGALAGGGRLFAALLAASYLAFTAFVVVALRRGTPLSTCGCFGTTDTPPTAVHVGINLAAAAVAGAVALGGGGAGGLLEIADESSWLLRVAFVALTAACVAFAYAALTLLPKLQKVSTA
jgi:hypothetical protein